jgi:protein O-mannosyl-transferase
MAAASVIRAEESELPKRIEARRSWVARCASRNFCPENAMSRRKKRKPRGSGSQARANSVAQPGGNASQAGGAFHGRWVSIAVCIFLALAVWAIFGQTLGFNFVYFDDNEYVFDNPHITHGLSLKAIRWAFTHVHSHNWHPLTTLTHMFDCQVYGLHPWGPHLENVLLHAMVAILLFVALQQMTGALWRSAFVAALFAVHPLHVESVAWISERKDVLSALFFMLTLMAYVRYTRLRGSGTATRLSFLRLPAYWVALLLFALGLMCKPMLVTLPFVLLLLDWWPLRRFTLRDTRPAIARLVWEKIPFLLLSAASCPVTIWAQKDIVKSLEQISFPFRVGNALVSYAAYVWQMIYPAGLAVLYPYPENLAPWKVGGSILFLLLVSAGVVVAAREHPYLLVGWLWYLGMLVPVIGLMQTGNQAMADRYTYLPQIGLYIMVAWGAVDLVGSWRYGRAVLGAGASAILVTLMVLAHVQTSYWKNGVSLMKHAIACTSNNYLAHNNLGAVLATQGKLVEAVKHIEQAIRLRPSYAEAQYNLANVLDTEGKWAQAIEHYERAIQLKPAYADAYNNLADVLATEGKTGEAIEVYERAIQLEPGSADANYGLGNALASQGKWAEAIEHYERVIQLEPDSADAYNNLGNVLASEGKMAEAIEHYQRAIQLKPGYDVANYNLGKALATQGKMAEAIKHYERAIQLNPNYAEAHYDLGNALAGQGNLQEAVQHLRQALDLATAQKNNALAEIIRTRLKSYQPASPETP